MGIFSGMFKGYRWSVYFCQGGKQMEYALHGNHITSMLALVPLSTTQLRDGWSVWFILNRKHSRDGMDHSFKLLSKHFDKKNSFPSESFFLELEQIDPEWKDNCRSNPTEYFMDKRGKEIPMRDPAKTKMYDALDNMDIHAFEKAFLNPPDNRKNVRNYWDVIDEVFDASLSRAV